jgi:hypothetical protein
VEQRQHGDGNRICSGVDQVAGHLGSRTKVGMGEGGTLRLARRAGGVDDRRGVVVVALDHLVDCVGCREQLIEANGLHDEALRAGIGTPLASFVLEIDPAEHQPRTRVGQVIGDLCALQERVHRHDHRTETQHRGVDDREVRDVRQLHADTVARFDAVGPQQPCRASNTLVQGPVRESHVVESHGWALS